jgi:hypothetical protein
LPKEGDAMTRFPDFQVLRRYCDEQIELFHASRITQATMRRRIRKAVKEFNKRLDAAWDAQRMNEIRGEKTYEPNAHS